MAHIVDVGTDDHFREVLENWYPEGVIRLGEYLYIVKDKNMYYFMQNEDGNPTFCVIDAIALPNITSIEVETTDVTYKKQTSDGRSIMIVTTIQRAMKELLQGA